MVRALRRFAVPMLGLLVGVCPLLATTAAHAEPNTPPLGPTSAPPPPVVEASPVTLTPSADDVSLDGPPAATPAPAPEATQVTPGAPAMTSADVQLHETAPVPPRPSVYQARSTKTNWYGWETLLVDGASIVAGLAMGKEDADTGGDVFLAGYVFGGPIVHFAHGNVGRGFASLGLRVGAPIVCGLTGAMAGLLIDAGHNNSHSSYGDDSFEATAVGAGLGVLTGYVAAVVIDAAALAREPVADVPDESGWHANQDASAHGNRESVTPKSGFSWTPTIAPVRSRATGSASAGVNGATAGISGTF